METIALKKSEVPKSILAAYPGYTGRKFRAKVATNVGIYGLSWSGGSCSTYRLVRIEDGEQAGAPGTNLAPWNNPYEGQKLDIPPGYVCIEHAIFCGKDMGLRITVHPDDVAKLLPAK